VKIVKTCLADTSIWFV